MAALFDITTEEDIVLLVDAFYAKITHDATIGFIFSEHMEEALEQHLPVIYTFWQSVLLGTQTYRGQIMQKHIELNSRVALTSEHFETWYQHWIQTIDAQFAGPLAEQAKQRAQTMKELMLFKISQSKDEGFIQ